MKLFHKLILLFVPFVGINTVATAQLPPCPVAQTSSLNAGNDTTACSGGCVTLHASGTTTLLSTSAYSYSQVAYNPQPYNQGTPIVLLTDDSWSSVINIPFAFCFFGTKYTQLVISSNGSVSFNTSQANGFSNYTISNAMPNNNTAYNNSICAPVFDMDMRYLGTIRYATYGSAPCRQFVVSWDSCGTYNCASAGGGGCPYIATQQIVLYESTNVIDINVKTHQYYSGSTSSGHATIGIQDATGTQAYAVPGKNNAQFNDTTHSYRFTPSGAPTTSYVWTNVNTGAQVGTTQNVTVCPNTITNYAVKAIYTSQCDSVILYDTVKVNIGFSTTITTTAKTDPTTCGGTNGSITLNTVTPNTPFTLTYRKNGSTIVTTSVVTSSTGSVIIPNLGAGVYDSIYLIGAPCRSNVVGPITLINPSLTANYNYLVKYGCSQDTVVFQNLSSTPGLLAYKWTFGDGSGDTAKNPVHIYTTQGTYNVRLIATNNTCADTIAKNISLLHPLHASFTVSKDSACSKQLVQFTNTSTVTTGNGIAPQYFWDFDDGNTSTQQSPSHTFNAAGTYHVRLVVKNFVPCYDTAYHTIVIDSLPYAFVTISDTALCSGKSALFTAHYMAMGLTGYEWNFSDGGYNQNVNPVLHAFDSTYQQKFTFTAHYRLCPDTVYHGVINVYNPPLINLGPDTAMCPGAAAIPLYDIANAGNPGVTYLWNTGATTSGINANAPGTYYATVTQHGCSSSDTVEVLNDCYLRIPNSFTPNGDGVNDYFLPRQLLSRSVISFNMNIYNRWGELIYSTSHIDGRGWDGKFNDVMQPEGVYVYMIDVLYRDGRKETYKGNVTMLR